VIGGLFGLLLMLFFALAQGGVIFVTALLCTRLIRANSNLAKLGLMLASYAFWIVLTIAGYTMLGGDGGLMDGFGLVLMLCFSALISTFIYAVVWALVPSKSDKANA
jgi:hypothetical protein